MFLGRFRRLTLVRFQVRVNATRVPYSQCSRRFLLYPTRRVVLGEIVQVRVNILFSVRGRGQSYVFFRDFNDVYVFRVGSYRGEARPIRFRRGR